MRSQMRGSWISFILLIPVAYCGPCPDGYTQAANGGDCFKGIAFKDFFAGVNIPTSFDEAETSCNEDNGGMLASIHSAEEDDTVLRFWDCGYLWHNIGMRCTGRDCEWDDGTPITYTNFANEPNDDGVTRCYGMTGLGQWTEKKCGEQEGDCWVCRVKARTIDCVDGETGYKGGCVSVHLTPLDQKSAESSCPGGGHLVSIHSTGKYSENDYYKNLASNAGINGTVYIGGQFSNGVFEWTDGTHYNKDHWANSFPNTIFGSCVQMLMDTEFGNQGQWTNIDCTVKQPYICFRDGADYGPTPTPTHPKAPANCPPVQYFTGSGTIFSPNYPLSIPGQQSCEYVLGTNEGTKASVKFTSYTCQSGTSLSLFDGLNGKEPFTTFTTNPPSQNQSYTASSNVLKMVFSTMDTVSPVGTGWEVEFNGT